MESNLYLIADKDSSLYLKSEVSFSLWISKLENNYGDKNKVRNVINKSLRNILKIKWQDKIQNEELWDITGQLDIEHEIGL